MSQKYCKIVFFLLSLFCIIGAPFFSWAATLRISPTSGTYEVGQKFTVRAIATSDIPFNAVSLSLLFPPSIFSIDSVSKSGSLLTFWVKEPTISSSAGTVSLEGVTPGGIKESTGTVIAITLHGTHVGSGNISFQSGQILANDGQGTDISGENTGAKFTVIPTKSKIIPPATVQEEPEMTPPQPPPTLNAPEIALGEKYGAQAITGTSEYPKIQVLITFLSKEGAKIFIMGNTDKDGAFTLVVPRSLKRGEYTITARVIGEGGINSSDGNIILITVGNFFSDFSIEVRWALILLLLFILYIIARILLHLRKDKKTRLAINKEIVEAKYVIHDSLDILKEEITEHLQETTKTAKHKDIVSMNKNIGDVEKIIQKEINDIDKIK
jgi:hypothetical protein